MKAIKRMVVNICFSNVGTRIPAAAMDVLDAVLDGNSGQKTTAWTRNLLIASGGYWRQ